MVEINDFTDDELPVKKKFFGNFEQPCTEHEIWTSRLRSFEAKNMKKGIICVDNTKRFAIKGHF